MTCSAKSWLPGCGQRIEDRAVGGPAPGARGGHGSCSGLMSGWGGGGKSGRRLRGFCGGCLPVPGGCRRNIDGCARACCGGSYCLGAAAEACPAFGRLMWPGWRAGHCGLRREANVLSGLVSGVVRRPLGWDFAPVEVLRLVRPDAHPVALVGAWAGGTDVIGSEPVLVAGPPCSLGEVLDWPGAAGVPGAGGGAGRAGGVGAGVAGRVWAGGGGGGGGWGGLRWPGSAAAGSAIWVSAFAGRCCRCPPRRAG